MLMENTLRLLKKDTLTKVYDLKGSRVDRTTSEAAGTHKDNNFIKKLQSDPDFLQLPKKHAAKSYKSLVKDVQFLQDCGLMDYSLLVGIEKCDQNADK